MSPSNALAAVALRPRAPADAANRATAWYGRQVSDLLTDLHRRSPAIYWTDLLLSAGGAWALTAVYFLAPAWSAAQLFAFVGAGILFYRAGTFIHEIIHFPRGELVWFRRAWNLLIGVPLLMPWVMYRNHLEHHNAHFFGTPDDGEYLPLAAAPLRETFKYLMQAPLLPVFVVARFGVLGPISWLHRGLREWVLTAASAGVTNPYYRRRFPASEEGHLRLVEALCLAYIAGFGTLLTLRIVTGAQLLMAYLLMTFALTLNWVRTMAAHGYANRGDRMSHAEQFEDSINITGQTWLTVLMFPVGLRYHALHHLVPTLPYHNLGEAHRRLSEALPADSPYHASCRHSFFATLAELWRAAQCTAPKDSAIPRWRQQNSRT